ncbi:hypothetical protein BD626DRAFT_571262 [Schizophyllum amplum]|uniref:Uncharacterized protein n=1 Tax=Schizophyllum amplum TaxID=97359 RepID=A0A550C7V5_9AGAR|nr:hypothetical protein BD626DRAFT_571262 [Auriculariopsis ampla]
MSKGEIKVSDAQGRHHGHHCPGEVFGAYHVFGAHHIVRASPSSLNATAFPTPSTPSVSNTTSTCDNSQSGKPFRWKEGKKWFLFEDGP